MVEENVGSESVDQLNLPTTTNISTDDSNLLAKPKAIDIYNRVVGNPLVGSNPGHRNPDVTNENYTDNLAKKIRNDALSTTNKYGNMQPYTYNGDVESVNFDRYYASKPFKTYGFSPYRDNESLYNDKMTFGDQFVRAASQWDNLVATGFTSGVRAWKTMFTDPLAPDIQGAQEMKKIMSVGASNTGGFGGFITNTFLNSGYTIGIMADLIAEEVALAGITAFSGGLAGEVTAPGMAAKFGMATRRLAGFGDAAKNIKTGARVTELAKEGNEALNTLKETKSTVNNWRNFYTGAVKGTVDLLNPLENTFKALKTVDYATDYAKISKTSGAFIQDMIQLKAAVSEAKLEGGMVKLDVNENLIKQYKLTHNGEEPTGLELQKIENISNQEAFRTAFWNLPAIVTSNKLLFGVISKPLDKVLGKSTVKLMNNQILENGVFKAAGQGVTNNFKNVVRGLKNPKVYGSAARDYLKVNFAEGIQENIQEAISTGAVNHAMAVYKDPLKAGYEGYMGHFMHGLKEQFSAQGAETFAGGFVMGMFVQPIMAGPAMGIAKIGKLFNNKEDIKAAKEARDQQLSKETDALNDLYKNDLNHFAPNVINAIKNSRLATNLSEAAEQGDKKQVGDDMFAIKSNHIMTALKTGNYDAFIDKLEDYKNMSVDEAAEAFKQYGLEKEDASKVLGKIDEIVANAKQIKKNYEEVAGNYPNPFDYQQYPPNSTKQQAAFESYKAWEEAQETLVFSKNLFDNYNERVSKMANAFSGISSAIGKTDAQKFMVLLDPNETESELEILKNEIKSLDDTIPEQKKLKTKKQKTRDALVEFSTALSNIKDAHAKKDTLENIEKLHKISKKIFNDYVNDISEKNNSIVFDKQVNEAYELIKDSHLMKNEMKGIAKTINVLNNPKGFLNLQERLTIATRLMRKDALETLQNNIKLFVNVTSKNDAINVISKKTGLVIPADYMIAFDEAEKNNKPLPVPTYFIDPITGDSVINGDKFNEAKDLWSIYMALTQKEAKPEVKETETDTVVKDFDPTDLATFPLDLINSLESKLIESKSNNEVDENMTLKEYIDTIPSAQQTVNEYAKTLKNKIITGSDVTYQEYLTFSIEELQTQLKELYEEVLIKPELISKIYDIQQALRFLKLSELNNKITRQQADTLLKLEDIKSKMDKNGDFYELDGKKLDTRVTKIVDEILNKEYGLKSYNFADEQGAEISKLYENLLKAPHNKTATVKELIDELKEKGKLIEIFQLRLNNNKLNKIQEGLEKDNSLENFKVLLNEYAYKETSIRGNTIDELGRKFLSGEELKKTDKITDSAFKDLFNILVEFQKNIEEKGEIILARNLRVNGTTTDSKTFGGEMDILVITPEGKFKIYDMKTAGNWSNFGSEKDGYNKKEKYGLQLSIYKNALENLTGIQVDEIELLPIQTKEDLDGNIISVKRVSNPEIKKLKYADYKEIVEKYVPSKMDTITPVSTDAKSDIEKLGVTLTNNDLEIIPFLIGEKKMSPHTSDENSIITSSDYTYIDKFGVYTKEGKRIQGLINSFSKRITDKLSEKLGWEKKEISFVRMDGTVQKELTWHDGSINKGSNENITKGFLEGKFDAELAVLGTDTKTNEQNTPNKQKIAEYRAQEREELAAKIPNIEEYKVDGKIRKSLIKDRKDYQTYVDIYKKYDELISPLLENEPKKETVSPYDKVGDYYISIPIERDGVESIIVTNKKGKGAIYEINTDANGSVIGLIPKNKPEQIITNEKLLVAVEIQRNKSAFNAVSKIEKLSETVVKSKKEIPITKILENVLNYDLTEKIANDIDSLYDNKPLDKEALISIQLWVNNTATRLNSLLREKEYENDPKLTRSWENMFIINELVSEKLNLINEKESKLNQKEVVVKKVKSKSVAQLQKIRDEELKIIQETRKKLNIEFDPLDDLPQSVSTTMERFDNDLPIDIIALNEASEWIYAKYKQISNMELDPFRLLTLKQIKSYQKTLEKDLIAIEKYKTTNYEKSILQDEAFESTDTNRTSDRKRTKETEPSKQTNFDEPIKKRVKKYREKRIKTLKTSVEKNKNIEIIDTDPTEVVETETIIPEIEVPIDNKTEIKRLETLNLLDEKTLSFFKSGIAQNVSGIEEKYLQRLKDIEYLSQPLNLINISQEAYNKLFNDILLDYKNKIQNVGKFRYEVNLASARDAELANLKRKYTQEQTSNTPETQTVEQFNQLSIPEKFAIITKELEGGKVLIGTYYQASSVAERKDLYTGMPDNLTQEVRLDDGRILQASQYNNNIFSANRVNVRLVEKLINGKLTKTLEVLTNGRQFTYIRENPVKWNVKTETKPVIIDLSLEDINKDINLDSLAIAKNKNYEVVYESVTKPEDNGRYIIESISKNSVTLTGLSKTIVIKTEEIKDNIKEVLNNEIIPSSPVDTETIINNINTVKKNDIVIDDTLTDMEEALRIINEKLC